MNPTITDESEFMDSLAGRVVKVGQVTPEGLHLIFEDGNILIIEGSPLVVCLGRIGRETLQ